MTELARTPHHQTGEKMKSVVRLFSVIEGEDEIQLRFAVKRLIMIKVMYVGYSPAVD
ncbi:MAG: hypothetical protein U5K84_13240 [Alkalibacterium sp.]|nr:hypothetical protein [Alkalibacterium sp.]